MHEQLAGVQQQVAELAARQDASADADFTADQQAALHAAMAAYLQEAVPGLIAPLLERSIREALDTRVAPLESQAEQAVSAAAEANTQASEAMTLAQASVAEWGQRLADARADMREEVQIARADVVGVQQAQGHLSQRLTELSDSLDGMRERLQALDRRVGDAEDAARQAREAAERSPQPEASDAAETRGSNGAATDKPDPIDRVELVPAEAQHVSCAAQQLLRMIRRHRAEGRPFEEVALWLAVCHLYPHDSGGYSRFVLDLTELDDAGLLAPFKIKPSPVTSSTQ